MFVDDASKAVDGAFIFTVFDDLFDDLNKAAQLIRFLGVDAVGLNHFFYPCFHVFISPVFDDFIQLPIDNLFQDNL